MPADPVIPHRQHGGADGGDPLRRGGELRDPPRRVRPLPSRSERREAAYRPLRQADRAHGRATGHSVKRIERTDGLWRIDDVAEAPVVVGAGGHFCPVARRLGAKVGSTEDIVAAHEVEFVMTDAQRADCAVAEETPEIFFCEDLKGYGWVFRKEDVLNVGLGREDNRNIADHVKAFCEWLAARGRIPRDMPSKFKGHAYILHGHSRRISSGDRDRPRGRRDRARLRPDRPRGRRDRARLRPETLGGTAKGSALPSSPRSSRPKSSRRPGARSTRPRSRTTSADSGSASASGGRRPIPRPGSRPGCGGRLRRGSSARAGSRDASSSTAGSSTAASPPSPRAEGFQAGPEARYSFRKALR